MRRVLGFSTAVVAVLLAACSTPPDAQTADVTGSVPAPVAPPKTVYDLANGCFALRADGFYVKRVSTTDPLGNTVVGFTTAGATADNAEHFRMRATGLSRYAFYATDGTAGQFLTGDGKAITATASPADGSDWTFAAMGFTDGTPMYTATTAGAPLARDASGALVQGSMPAVLTFVAAAGCPDYPEMPLDIGETFRGPGKGGRVIGFAEVHTHMGMGSEMSDGAPQNHAGPSAGGVMYGQAMNRFGVIEALKDCVNMHGPQGILSPENIILDQDPTEHHDTVGWPTFVDWPKHDSFLHQQMYYRWVERAYRAGLRTMVVHGTNIEALCNVAKQTGGNKDTNYGDEECRDMEVGEGQVKYLYQIQDYIDAQAGGPGKGFFRIVKDPDEARGVIAEGKLAVIPGLEFSNIFHCNVTFSPDGSETDGCTKEDIDKGIEEAWNLGVRQVFPYHDVDSALGGTGIFDGAALDLVGFYGTHGFWKTYDCPDGGEGPAYFYNAGAFMYNSGAPAGFGADPISQALIAATQGNLPTYPTGKRQCNARGVTDLGKYAIRKIMEKGFVLDIDHAELSIKQYMLDQGSLTTPYYPMVSGHGGHGGISTAQATQLIKQGGIIYPGLPNGADYVDFVKKIKPVWTASGTDRPLAVGYGADANGLRTLPDSRGSGHTPIQFPFTLFRGDGWSGRLKGMDPIQVDQLAIPGGKAWSTDAEGMSHYGLVPDIVEEIRLEAIDKTKDANYGLKATEPLDALYNSAEAYLELWEQTRAASKSAQSSLPPLDPPAP